MNGSGWIIMILVVEAALFVFEVFRAVLSPKNKRLLKANSIDDVTFIDIEKGYWTKISWFRISLVLAYCILVAIYIDFSKKNFFEELLVYMAIGVLLYVIILKNIKLFIFRKSSFMVVSLFNPRTRSVSYNYDKIKNFRIYRALYNAFVLVLDIEGQGVERIEFSGTSIPRNDLIIRIILNTVTGLKKDFIRKKY